MRVNTKILLYILAAAVCVAATAVLVTCGKSFRQKKPNVILITLDTTRADHLGCYGYSRPTSPNLDRFAEEAVLYTRCISTCSWTLPAHASLFTGKFTTSHGAKHDPNGPLHLADAVDEDRSRVNIRARGLSPYEMTLAEVLKREGYSTAGIVGGPWMKVIFGLDKGFEYYDDSQISTSGGRPANLVNDSAFEWLDRQGDRPVFLFLNYFDPHYPFEPPEEYARKFVGPDVDLSLEKQPEDVKIALYDAEILYMDECLERLFDKLKKDGLYKNSMIVITADHGELLGDHGLWGHGKHLTQAEIHVPLMIKYPGDLVPASRLDQYVQTVDIFAMILNQLRIPLPENIQGEVPPAVTHPIMSETFPLRSSHQRALFEDDFKLVWHDRGRDELFNIKRDPRELHNLIVQRPDVHQRMVIRLERYVETLPTAAPPSPEKTVDKKTREALKSLGYLQ